MSEQITKIKVNNDQTATIWFKDSDDLATNEIICTGKEKITDEFKNAFNDSVNSFVEICPAFKNFAKDLTMNTIKFDYGKSEKLEKVSYSVKYQPQSNILTNIPVNNVPIYREEFTEKTFSVSGKDEQLLYSILDFALKYKAGETRTKQMKLEVVND